MDQSFNDLLAYEETIENYIKALKELTKGTEIVIYLVYFPQFPKNPHPGTYQSTIMYVYFKLVITMGKKEDATATGKAEGVQRQKLADLEKIIEKTCLGIQVLFVCDVIRNIKLLQTV